MGFAWRRRGRDAPRYGVAAGETLLVLQNWTDRACDFEVSFTVSAASVPSYLADEKVDRDVKGRVTGEPILSREAERRGERAFRLGPFGYAVYEIK